jgi:hypothetical protein
MSRSAASQCEALHSVRPCRHQTPGQGEVGNRALLHSVRPCQALEQGEEGKAAVLYSVGRSVFVSRRHLCCAVPLGYGYVRYRNS